MQSLKLMSCFVVAVCISCGRTNSVPESWQNFETRIELNQVGDVEHAISHASNSDRAVVFVHVSWNGNMRYLAPKFMELAETYLSTAGLPPVGFHYIDCTAISDDYGPLRKLTGWNDLEAENQGSSLVGGWGEVVWLEHGRVIKVEPLEYTDKPADLLLETLNTFQIRT